MEQQRLLLVQDYEEGASITELAAIYGISRKTIYKWLERHERQGVIGLADLSRRPHESPNRVSAEVEKAIRKQFAKKVKAANLNLAAVQAGFDYAAANLPKRDPYVIQRMDKTTGKIIIDGNAAAALGCMFAGVTMVSSCSPLVTRNAPAAGASSIIVCSRESEAT